MVILYLTVTLAALVFVNVMSVRWVEQYLADKLVNSNTEEAEHMAVEVVPLLLAGNSADLYDYVCENAQRIGGRVLVVDRYGVVQTDAFSTYNGIKMTHEEIVNVLNGSKPHDYGLHYFYVAENQEPSYGIGVLEELRRFFTAREDDHQNVLYVAAPMVSENEIIGALVLSISIQDEVNRISRLRWRLNLFTGLVCLVMIVMNFILSGAIIRPVRELTRGIRILGQGHFSHRVRVKGRSEFARMAETFNAMSERLESIDRMRTEFVSNASHELKTPLSSIKILVQTLLAQKPFDPAMTEEFLGDVNSEVDRMSALVGDLLVLVRMDEEAVQNFETVDFSMIVEDAASSLEPLATQKQIQLEVSVEQGLTLQGEGGSLRQMAVNLIDNAIKYTPAGGTVSVHLARRSRELVFRVRDTGIGIAEKDLPYIFDRFYRVDKARGRQTGGTGLGLSIVKGIVAHHGGIIDVNSKEGHGTEMIVVLPGSVQQIQPNS